MPSQEIHPQDNRDSPREEYKQMMCIKKHFCLTTLEGILFLEWWGSLSVECWGSLVHFRRRRNFLAENPFSRVVRFLGTFQKKKELPCYISEEEETSFFLKICKFCVLFSIAKISIPVGMFRRLLQISAIEQTDGLTQDLYYRYKYDWPTPD